MRSSEKVFILIRGAAKQARQLGHSCVGSAHLLLQLSREQGLCGQLLREAGVEKEFLRDMLLQLLPVSVWGF